MEKMLLIAILFLGACGNAAPTKTAKPSDKPSESKEEPLVTKTDCKICDYDYEKYTSELEKKEIEGLLLALNDEYMATATYIAINKKFDNPRPFVNIVKAEARHSSRLRELFDTYGVVFPKDNPWIGKTPDYDSVVDACKAGIKAEEENAALYERLFDSTERDDILRVYKNLRRASIENHKPAFERCTSGKGNGKGFGRRKGNGSDN